MTFNVNFESLSSLIRVHLLVYELYSRQNARYNNKKKFKKINKYYTNVRQHNLFIL